MALIIGSNDSDSGASGLGNLVGTAAADIIFGLDGDDAAFGGTGDDIGILGAGDDLFGWNPGDGNDRIEGGEGYDTMLFNGANAAEQIDMSAVGERFRFFRDVANVVMDTDELEQVNFNAFGGEDTVTINDLTGTDIKQINIDLSAFGSNDGDGAADTVIINGSDRTDAISVSGSAGQTIVSGLAAEVQIIGGEADSDRLVINPLSGLDEVTINDLADSGLNSVEINLAAPNSDSGDGFPDLVTLNASDRADVINISGVPGDVTVSGLGAEIKIIGAEVDRDPLVINGLAGDDTIDASNLAAGAMQLLIDGGEGDNTLIGGGENDTFIGGKGNDFAIGEGGDDRAFLGAGKDAFLWNPGDGNDTIDGGSGYDTMIFNGSGGNEIIDMLASGERFSFLRNIGNIVMDTNNLEQVDFQALGGTDTININDLTGTDIKKISLDLGGPDADGGDGEADMVNVIGSAENDVIQIRGAANDIVVAGLSAKVAIADADAALDSLLVSGGDGNDRISAAGLKPNAIQLIIDGGAGNDGLTGSKGDDSLIGGIGDDTLLGGRGADSLTGGEGQDSFRFDDLHEGGDTITDFVVDDDRILIRAEGFGGGLVAGSAISADQFTLGMAANSAANRFIYNNSSGELFFDRDGSGGADQTLIATLSGAPALSNTDLVVI